MKTPWRIELFGGLRLLHGERVETRFRTQKTAQLLAFLACFRRRPHPRELLMDLLWPECEPEAARHSLSVALSALRSQLEPAGVFPPGSVLITDRHAVQLDGGLVTTDVAEFEAAIKTAERSENESEQASARRSAIDLFGGELLPGYYDEWILPERQRLESLFFYALQQLIVQLERNQEIGAALQYALRWAAVDRFREEAHEAVIRLYVTSGRQDAAMRHYRELERTLRLELDTEPSSKAPNQRAASSSRRREQLLALAEAANSGKIATPAEGASAREPRRADAMPDLFPVGGAVPIGSRYYVERPTDLEFRSAITRGDSIVLVKGPRQVGKTSLLARGLQEARDAGSRVVMTQLQTLNVRHMESPDTFLRGLAALIADQLDLDVLPADVWDSRSGPNLNFRRYLRRHVLKASAAHLVWGLDEVDRIFSCSFSGEIFALFRSWHDERALEPGGAWAGLTLAIAYSTEAHLFITDINQSPFNVGTRVTLQDFTMQQVSELNGRYGSPLRVATEIARYVALVGGHPYLVSAGLHEMAVQSVELADFEARACEDDCIFGEHLRRVATLLIRQPDHMAIVRGLIAGRPCASRESFYRLRSAGIVAGESLDAAHLRCPLYAGYLQNHLPSSDP